MHVGGSAAVGTASKLGLLRYEGTSVGNLDFLLHSYIVAKSCHFSENK